MTLTSDIILINTVFQPFIMLTKKRKVNKKMSNNVNFSKIESLFPVKRKTRLESFRTWLTGEKWDGRL